MTITQQSFGLILQSTILVGIALGLAGIAGVAAARKRPAIKLKVKK